MLGARQAHVHNTAELQLRMQAGKAQPCSLQSGSDMLQASLIAAVMKIHSKHCSFKGPAIPQVSDTLGRRSDKLTCYQVIYFACCVPPDFWPGSIVVYFRIGRVLKLLQAKSVWYGADQLLALADGSCHALQTSDGDKHLAYFMLHSYLDQAA